MGANFITIQLLCLIIGNVLGHNFHVLSFGGYPWKSEVFLVDAMNSDNYCEISPLPSVATSKPFGGFMQDKLTICGGSLKKCYYYDRDSRKWKESLQLGLLGHSSLVTTFDYSHWTFFGGDYNTENFHFWHTGMNEFSKENLGFEIGLGACSARLNQSHAIISKGSQFSHLFQEEGFKVTKLTEGSRRVRHAACGLLETEDGKIQFVSAGGISDNSGRRGFYETEFYSLDENVWTDGQSLPEPITSAASVQFQNTFMLLGGKSDLDQSLTFFYDNSEGWLELPLILDDMVTSLGGIHLPAGKLLC